MSSEMRASQKMGTSAIKTSFSNTASPLISHSTAGVKVCGQQKKSGYHGAQQPRLKCGCRLAEDVPGKQCAGSKDVRRA